MFVVVAGGMISALFYYIQAFSPIFAVFIALPLALIGLSRDYLMLLKASLLAALLVTLGSSFTSGILYLALNSIPLAILVNRLLLHRTQERTVEWYPLSFAISYVSAYGVLFCIVSTLFVAPAVQPHIQETIEHIETQISPDQGKVLIDALRIVQAVTGGLSAISMLIWTIISAYFAQTLLVRFKHAMRPMPALNALTLTWWHWVVFAFSGALWALTSGSLSVLGLNIIVFLCFIFFLHGLSIVHYCLNKVKKPMLGLLIFYGSMLLLGWIIFSLVVLLGLFEPWANVRQKLSKKLGS
ncbi:MAG: YybS family protein [Alphaproteobacteria bacterium]|nr:YybS family protein [Alphaproteobacteria bacterium]